MVWHRQQFHINTWAGHYVTTTGFVRENIRLKHKRLVYLHKGYIYSHFPFVDVKDVDVQHRASLALTVCLLILKSNVILWNVVYRLVFIAVHAYWVTRSLQYKVITVRFITVTSLISETTKVPLEDSSPDNVTVDQWLDDLLLLGVSVVAMKGLYFLALLS